MYLLHAFDKKGTRTPQQDLRTARQRKRDLLGE